METSTLQRPVPARRPVSEWRHQIAHRRRLARADLLGVAAWVSAGMAIALWLAAAPVRLASPGDVITAAGIAAGMIGTDLILVMIVLAARIPVIERTIGHDAAMTVHGSLGKPALYLLLAHAGLLVVGYAATDGSSWLAETISLLTVSDVLLATLGLLGIAAVVITSIVAVRALLPYEAWYLIHLGSYVAVWIALPHQLSMGGMLAQGSWQRAYWLALYVGSFGAIVWFRFAVPLVRSIRHRVVVERVQEVAPGVVSLWLRGRNLNELQARGGQFFIWRFWSGSTWWHGHPLSLSAAPTPTHARVTVRALGHGSHRLASLRRGTRVSFAGPYGIFSDQARSRSRIAVAASGIGVTPIRAFLENLDAAPGEVTILLRARSERETYLWDEILAWARDTGAACYTSVGRRGAGSAAWLSATDEARGVSAATIWPDLAASDLYVCGPAGWADCVEADARRAGLHPEQLHRERFDW